MRKNGWPINESSENILNLGERFDDGIVFRSEDYQSPSLVGLPVQIGQHVKYILQGLGYPRKDSYAIILNVWNNAVKALWQDGSVQIWMRTDWKLQSGQRVYSVGDEVWYNVQPDGQSKRRGILTGFTGPDSEHTTEFTVRDVANGTVLTLPATDVIWRADLPGNNAEVNSIYNVRKVNEQEP